MRIAPRCRRRARFDEVAQLYLHHDVSSVEVPDRALKGFFARAPEDWRIETRELPFEAKRACSVEQESSMGRRAWRVHCFRRWLVECYAGHEVHDFSLGAKSSSGTDSVRAEGATWLASRLPRPPASVV